MAEGFDEECRMKKQRLSKIFRKEGEDVAINYKKCPKCSSLNSIKILYGMPTDEIFLMSEERRIKLGGCCITGSDPEYYCKDCENEWGKQDAIKHVYNQIKGIKASVGGYLGGHYGVEIDFVGRSLTWSTPLSSIENNYEKTIRQSSINRFIEEIKAINLLNWKSKYIEPNVCDGTQWSVEIIRNGRNIKIYGSNKFPDEWDEFCETISRLTGNEFR